LRQARAVYETLRRSNHESSATISLGHVLVAGISVPHFGGALDVGRYCNRAFRGAPVSEPTAAETDRFFGRRARTTSRSIRCPRRHGEYHLDPITAKTGFSRSIAGSAGSGLIWEPSGEILTNNHVVSGSEKLTVTLADKKVYNAKVLGIDGANRTWR